MAPEERARREIDRQLEAAGWMLQDFQQMDLFAGVGIADRQLRAGLRDMPPLDTEKLWPPQVQAITNLERSLRDNRPRSLLQMTMGSGKTHTAVSLVYRLIKYAGARRVLFLVDRKNLGTQ